MEIKEELIPESSYNLKCPYSMTPKYITIHNTANNCSARNEIAYLKSNELSTSCHIFVDDVEALQVIPFNRNAWHCGDGLLGTGNRQSIGIEICYSTDYDTDRHEKAFYNAVEVTKQLMEKYSIPIENVVQHNNWSGKNCPHRIRAEGTWDKFLLLCGGGYMEFKDGYQKCSHNSQTIHVYKQSGNEKLALYSLPYGTVKYITDFDVDEINGKKVKVNAIVNASYFEMGGSNGFLGRVQSLTYSGTTLGLGEDGFVGYKGTADKPFMDLVVLDDGSVKCGDFNSWEYTDVMLGVSPAGVQINDGKNINLYSPECGYSKITTANTQTLLLKDKDGKFALAVVSGRLSPLECRSWSNQYGVIHQSCYDSGGSSQMVVNSEKIVYTGRMIPVCFIIYEELNDSETTQNEPQNELVESIEKPKSRYLYCKCIKTTTSKGYPTRSTVKKDSGFTSDYIKKGEIIRFDDIDSMAGKEDGYCHINDITSLNGKWFAYDPDYFEGATEEEWLDGRGIDIE